MDPSKVHQLSAPSGSSGPAVSPPASPGIGPRKLTPRTVNFHVKPAAGASAAPASSTRSPPVNSSSAPVNLKPLALSLAAPGGFDGGLNSVPASPRPDADDDDINEDSDEDDLDAQQKSAAALLAQSQRKPSQAEIQGFETAKRRAAAEILTQKPKINTTHRGSLLQALKPTDLEEGRGGPSLLERVARPPQIKIVKELAVSPSQSQATTDQPANGLAPPAGTLAPPGRRESGLSRIRSWSVEQRKEKDLKTWQEVSEVLQELMKPPVNKQPSLPTIAEPVSGTAASQSSASSPFIPVSPASAGSDLTDIKPLGANSARIGASMGIAPAFIRPQGNSTKSLPTDLLGLLRTSVGYRYMLIHLYREYSEENLLVLKAIESFRRAPSIDSLRTIWHRYLAGDAELQVNISSATRLNVQRIKEALEGGAKFIMPPQMVDGEVPELISVDHECKEASGSVVMVQVLDEVFKEIVRLLDRDSFQRFKQTPLWNDYLSGLKPPDSLRRAGDAEIELADTEDGESAAAAPAQAAVLSKEKSKRRSVLRMQTDQRPTDFTALLHTYAGFRFFLTFLFSVECDSQLLCYRAIDIFFKFPSLKTLKKFTRTYIEEGAPARVHGVEGVERVLALVTAASGAQDEHLFAQINENMKLLQQELKTEVETSLFPAYKMSTLWKDYCNGLDAPSFESLAERGKENAKWRLRNIDEILAASMLIGEDEESHTAAAQAESAVVVPIAVVNRAQHSKSESTSTNVSASFAAAAAAAASITSMAIEVEPGAGPIVLSPSGRPVPESRLKGTKTALGIICVSVWFSAPSHELNVWIHAAHHLPISDSRGAIDPSFFVKLYVLPDFNKKSKQKTKRKNGPFAKFNQQFKFEMNQESLVGKRIELSLWSYRLSGANDYHGQTNIPLPPPSDSSKDLNCSMWYAFEPIAWVSRKEKPI